MHICGCFMHACACVFTHVSGCMRVLGDSVRRSFCVCVWACVLSCVCVCNCSWVGEYVFVCVPKCVYDGSGVVCVCVCAWRWVSGALEHRALLLIWLASTSPSPPPPPTSGTPAGPVLQPTSEIPWLSAAASASSSLPAWFTASPSKPSGLARGKLRLLGGRYAHTSLGRRDPAGWCSWGPGDMGPGICGLPPSRGEGLFMLKHTLTPPSLPMTHRGTVSLRM